MSRSFITLLFLFLLLSCSISKKATNIPNDLVISFGSCNKQFVQNTLWKEVVKHNPTAWIWGGDVVYSDTDNMIKLQKDYNQQTQQIGYNELKKATKILGTWDDHDYGLNDGGEEFHAKKGSQQLFLDFIGVSKNDSRRQREGVYHNEILKSSGGEVNIIILDTRYFRTSLTKSKDANKRYDPNKYGEGTVLGEQQWKWLNNVLYNSASGFNVIVSSIQFLSSEHGFESWGNFPHEVDKLKNLIKASKAKGVIVLSGDRHISEFSKNQITDVDYPLIDFTSSGLTHSYNNFKSEKNPFRVGHVVAEKSFGLLKFNFNNKTVTMEMRGKNNVLLQELIQSY